MFFDQFLQRHSHFLFHRARLVDVAGNVEKLGAGVVGFAQAGEPFGAAAQDRRGNSDGFDVVDRRRAAIEADVGGEWWFQARLAFFALQAFDQGRFLAADVSPHAPVDVKIELVAGLARVVADQAGVVGFVDGPLQGLGLTEKLAADVTVGGMSAHGQRGHQCPFDQLVGFVAHDLPVLASAGFAFVGVDDKVMGPFADLLGHERPFYAGPEAGTAAAAQARFLDLVDDLFAPLVQN